MISYIEWIKKSVGLCLENPERTEEQRAEQFGILEQEYLAMSAEEQKAISEVMLSQFEVNDLIFVGSYFMKYMKQIKTFQADMLTAVLRGKYDAYIGSMLECNITHNLDGHYGEKRLLHRQNAERFDRILDIKFPYLPFAQRNKKRIVIIAEQIMFLQHAPTKMVLEYIYILQEYLGYEILLFACPCDGFLTENLWNSGQYLRRMTRDEFVNEAIRVFYRGAEIFGYQINMTKFGPKEYNMMFSMIYAFNPLFVFQCGVSNPVADLARKFTTVVSMPMSIQAAVSDADILIRNGGRLSEEIEAEYEEALIENQVQLFERGAEVSFEASAEKQDRPELGLPEDKFLIAVVGNRLDEEMDEEFIGVMKSILERTENTAIVTVGDMKEKKNLFAGTEFENRMYHLEWQKNLLKTYTALDLYLNPNRNGGGHSGLMAVVSGIPVVTLPGNDVASNAGERFVVADYDEMVREVCRYVTDEEYYRLQSEAALEYVQKNTAEKQVKDMKKMLDSIIKIMEEK